MSTVNVFDTGAFDFGVTVGPSTSTTSPLREDDPNILYGDDQDDFRNYVFSPFTVHHASDDDEAPFVTPPNQNGGNIRGRRTSYSVS